jgi:[acyl-carrier-protein] S-malonyltransferase
MAFMAAQGVKLFCEVGSGKVLSGLVKRTAPEAMGLALGTPADIAQGAAQLKQG